MITRKSFLIRWLLVRNANEPEVERSVIDIEHIQTGSSQRVSNLEEASQWMRDAGCEPEDRGFATDSAKDGHT